MEGAAEQTTRQHAEGVSQIHDRLARPWLHVCPLVRLGSENLQAGRGGEQEGQRSQIGMGHLRDIRRRLTYSMRVVLEQAHHVG